MFSWYDTGAKKEQKYYTLDIINGVHLQWYENGQKKLEGNYINGKYDGIWTQWFLMVKNLLKVSIMKIC